MIKNIISRQVIHGVEDKPGSIQIPRKSIRVVIADDEPLSLKTLKGLLRNYEDFEIVGEAGDGLKATSLIQDLGPDVAFLDIGMPGWDGLDVANKLRAKSRTKIVFITGHQDYALRAFEAGAMEYLLKPVSHDRFSAVVDRIRRDFTRETLVAGLHRALDDARTIGLNGSSSGSVIDKDKRFSDKIAIKANGKIYFIAVRDIDWIEAAGVYTKLHLGSLRYMVRERLYTLQSKLDPRHFARVHRSFIVNVDKIKELQPLLGGDYQIKLHTGALVTLSRRYRQSLVSIIGAVMK